MFGRSFFLSLYILHLLAIGVGVTVAPDHIHWHTLGRTPLDEGSACGRDLYLTTQHSQETDIHVSDRIRTRNPSRRAAAHPRLRPRGHRDQLFGRSQFQISRQMPDFLRLWWLSWVPPLRYSNHRATLSYAELLPVRVITTPLGATRNRPYILEK
jgi:hypothetical protein